MRRILLALVSVVLMGLTMVIYMGEIFVVKAQQTEPVTLVDLNTDRFPQISSFLDVRDAQGDFVHGLEKADVKVVEDEVTIPVRQFNQLRPGVQMVLAINPGRSFAIQDVQGISRYDYLVEALQSWVNSRQGSSIDDLSILAEDGPEATHLDDVDRWFATLKSYQPNARVAVPQFDILGRAMEVAADPTQRPGMGHAILFITSLPEGDIGLVFQSLASRARLNDTRIFVWLVASPEQFTSSDAQELANLADQTGGDIFYYSGQESIPNLEDYFEPLRNTYYLEYASHITTSGNHQISVQIQKESFEGSSSEREFELEVMPPNVAFISPPPEIERKRDQKQIDDPAAITPRMQSLEVLIEFPDGHERPIRRTSLYVDGSLVDENISAPFDHFTWDLKEYLNSGQHTLKAEVVDSLGLSSLSVDTPVLVMVERPRTGILMLLSRNRSLLAGSAVILAGAVLLLVLIVGGRVKPGAMRVMGRRQKRTDPVTQPVRVQAEPVVKRIPGWINRLQWPHRRAATNAYAFLTPYSDSEELNSTPPIALMNNEITFGSDATQATQVLDDPSVDGLHARLRRLEDGSFRLSDEGSIAGTWINYGPVSKDGAVLQHGDLVHLGKMGFLFTVRDPKHVRKPRITREEIRP